MRKIKKLLQGGHYGKKVKRIFEIMSRNGPKVLENESRFEYVIRNFDSVSSEKMKKIKEFFWGKNVGLNKNSKLQKRGRKNQKN